MSVTRPKFMDSPYFVPEDENWHLLEGAPADVVKEFEKYMKEKEEADDRGIDI